MHNTLPAFAGGEAIRRFGEMVAQNLNIEQMAITIAEVRTGHDWALTRRNFISKSVPNNETDASNVAAQSGRFMLLWERQRGGT